MYIHICVCVTCIYLKQKYTSFHLVIILWIQSAFQQGSMCGISPTKKQKTMNCWWNHECSVLVAQKCFRLKLFVVFSDSLMNHII